MLTRLIYTLMVLWLTAVACATPTTPEAIIETAVPPTHTPQPTATTAPTATPEPTATPTAEEQANQLLLADGRFTTLLAELTQEIGRGLSDAEREQAMALARALWLPGQLDESDWLPDPAGVTLHWRPALDGREGPVLRVVEAQADSPYAAGAVIFWQGERLLSLTPTQPGYYFEFGRIQQNGWDFDTWIEYDAEGNVVSFVHPDTMQYVTRESEDWSIFTLSDLDPQGNRVNERLVWENGGTPTEITTGPGNVPIADYLTANPGHTLSEIDGQLAIVDGDTLLFTYDGDTWLPAPEQAEMEGKDFDISTPFVFSPTDSRGLLFGEIPAGVNPNNLKTLPELISSARENGFHPTYGCSREIEDGYRVQTYAVVVGHGTETSSYPGISFVREGFYYQTCIIGSNGEIGTAIFFGHYKTSYGPDTLEQNKTHDLSRDRVAYVIWDPNIGQATDESISPDTLAENPHIYLGQFAVLADQPTSIPNNTGQRIFADMTQHKRGGFKEIHKTEFNYEFPIVQPFGSGPIALVIPEE
jgi:hypothetical protein